jgi:hypothetical protein
MSKPLAGKRWFYSMGVRSLDDSYTGPWPQSSWTTWARIAFFRGQDDGRWARARNTTKQWSSQKLADSLLEAPHV